MTVIDVMHVMANDFTDEELAKIEIWLSSKRKRRAKQQYQTDCKKLLKALDEFIEKYPYEKIAYACSTCHDCDGIIEIELEQISHCISDWLD